MPENFPLFAGVLASMLHVITGPDHLAAVIPFAVESKRKAWKIGLSWGLGHLAGMTSIGVLFLFFKAVIPVEAISTYSEKLVGLVLIFIGVWSFYKLVSHSKKHSHLHVHALKHTLIHKHPHQHNGQPQHEHTHLAERDQNLFASGSIGFLHGLAGIAHFLLFLPLLGFQSHADTSAYIGGFVVGILLAMGAFTFIIGKIAAYTKNEHNEIFFKGIRLAAGLFAVVIGLYWLFAH